MKRSKDIKKWFERHAEIAAILIAYFLMRGRKNLNVDKTNAISYIVNCRSNGWL